MKSERRWGFSCEEVGAVLSLLAGSEKVVQERKIRNAVIPAGVESLRNYDVHQVSSGTFPSKSIFVKAPAAPSDLIHREWVRTRGGRIAIGAKRAAPRREGKTTGAKVATIGSSVHPVRRRAASHSL